ncbi:neuroblastoma-amplified sequence [Nasonia vitripennis]|uniref:Neuroblastoma-amplified sequence n=1 Tax=Nasonia vitripennis TaxID=7425 RepID=A0A7M7LQ89_NASVI|nr:neuroblastoma-amplified sequence [Nasonia vitripennis]
MSDKNDDLENESILYEVLEYFVRKQEPELTKFKNDTVALPTPGTIKNALRYLNNRYSLPESISQQVSYTLPWKFAIGDRGRILAILQENIIEIRKSKDEYSSIVGKASVPKDAFPQWRKLAWSPDGSILALSSSNGYVSFYNSFGNNIFNISPKSVSQNPHILEAGDATASMIFKKPRVKSETWDYEFIRVTYSGLLKSYCISANKFSENHEFSFGNFYRDGVNSVSYSEKHNLFFVAGNSVTQTLTCIASEIGLTCWRTLNDHPYYKLSVSSQDIEIYKSSFSIWNFIPVIKNRTQSLIFKTSISPNDKLISCLHTDGTISIWSAPTLKLQKQWKLFEQPNYNAINPIKTMRFKKSLNNVSEYQPLDVGWWSDNAVIIARYSGSVSVCSIHTLKNLLGTSPEFLYSHPQIAELGESKGFLCLDCEVVVTSTKRNRDSNGESPVSELSSDSERDDDESKPATLLNYTTNLMQSALYSITDIEKFQPKRKKSRVFHRTYRLIGLKSTTPEELYSRKIEIEEYEEALNLAKTYNLDPDLVYQTQWRKSEFSVNAIQEHLSKVSKRSWVLNECVSRVPETLEATRELLNFGLRGANLETLVALGIEDNGKFTPAEDNEDDDVNSDENSQQLKKVQKINQKIDAATKNSLNKSQKELIKYRKKLLDHLDKLQTYEILLESPSKFDKKFYEEFRQLSPLENAVKFAKSGNCQGVEVMFTYYGAKLIPHWLTVISFFPETLSPEKYQKLLPECDIEGRLFLLFQQELRQKDWVERSIFSEIISLESNDDDIEFIYTEKTSLLAYRNKELTQDLLQKWYIDRAYEIERDSRLVDNALALINIGKSHNIDGLEKLLFELETLDDLVYKVGFEDLSLTKVEKLSDLEKIKLLMTKSDEKNFVNIVKSMLLPYSRRRRRYINETLEKDLLYDYLVHLSKDDLALPVKFFESLKVSFDPEILDTIENVSALALDCIYACTDVEMYPKAKAIFDAAVVHSSGREDSSKKYKELEKELKCLQMLNKYEVKIPLNEVRQSKQNSLEAKALLVQMSENLINIYPMPNEKNWSQLLNDMLDLQEQIFSCLDIETCFEISMVARLKSRSKTAIQGCTNLMEMKKTGRSHLKVSYERAIDFILEESNNYFNNSKSLTDPDMELAKECLQLITDNDERVKEEYDLIESLQILHEFHINILPLQVRMTQDRIKLIEDCLNSRNDAYKSKQKLINLSKYLRIERKNNKLREAKVLNLIAKKAFEKKDYNFSSSTVQQMMKNHYQSAWSIALDLAYCDDYNDLPIRWNCIWFAINNGSSDILENAMKRANLLKVQILNSDLKKWMPSEVENSEGEDNTDSDFTDVFSTPLSENKEFVPKIVQTSTELVKSSAQIVKQSTFDLIKSAGNKNFWTSKLNFNFAGTAHKVTENEIIEKKKQGPLQKFPCFYETLHENCGVSDLDTKYSKYSQDDYNAKLKLSQTLLRILLLSETASYGAEVSDVNHLLLECAEHTIIEDCTMGLSYLLNLPDDYLPSITEFFENLPKNELYSQILAYFCAVKLYSKMFPESDKVFSYAPVELIRHMSSITNSSNNEDEVKLKKQINSLIQKKEKIDDRCESSIENKELEEKRFVSKDIEDSEKKKSPLDYVPPSEEIDNWDDNWGNDTSLNATEFEEKSNDNKEEIKTKSMLDYVPANEEMNGWNNDWVNESTENANGFEENSSDKKTATNENLTLDYILSPEETNDWGDWGDTSKDEIGLEKNSNDTGSEIKQKSALEYVPSADDTSGWDNNWEDETLNEHLVELEDRPSNTNNKSETEGLSTLDYVPPAKEKDEWNNWEEEWPDIPESVNDNVERPDSANMNTEEIASSSELSIEQRYEICKENVLNIQTIDDCKKFKDMLLQCPDINNLSFDDDSESNLALSMIIKMANICATSSNSNDTVFHEIKDFLCEELIPRDVFVKFLEDKRDSFSLEQYIYLQLCSKESSLQIKAINCIKDNYKTLNLNSAILEEIFFNNLTSSFSVSHELYYRIIEEVFLNRTLPEIEENVKLLIKNLVEQRNVPHAIALLNQLEAIPSSLSTYENCFKLLLRK